MNLRRTKKLELEEVIYLITHYKFRKLNNGDIEITYPQQPKRVTITKINTSSKLWFSSSMNRTTITLSPIAKKAFYIDSHYNLILLQSLCNEGIEINKLLKEDLAKEYDRIAHSLFLFTGLVF